MILPTHYWQCNTPKLLKRKVLFAPARGHLQLLHRPTTTPSLPSLLSNKYRKYKADTERIVHWLANTATTLGFELPSTTPAPAPAPLPRLKGKARKLARQAAQHSNFNKPNPPPPQPQQFGVNTLVELAVPEESATWFGRQQGKTTSEVESDMGHWHFIEVLERVAETLNPLAGGVRGEPPKQPVGSGDEYFNENKFHVFEDEEVDENDEPDTPSPTSTTTPPKTPTYKLENTESNEDWFALFCFFQDLHAIRSFLIDTWSQYHARKIDLITATVTTNTAFEVVRSLHQELISLIPSLEDNRYEPVANMMLVHYWTSRGEEVKPINTNNLYLPEVAPFSDFAFYHTFDILNSFCKSNTAGVLPPQRTDLAGVYDPSVERNSLTPKEQLQDGALLSSLLPNFRALGLNFEARFLYDELTKEFGAMCVTKHISLLAVYAAQIFLDIHHILRAVSQAHQNAISTCNNIT
ncbi:hypothetical protein HDV00_004696 [Rhizophlyctis rosea]|nr:hypothetical protein HDV00_004696 [Rhizophlyctis rosea]